jgi:hypothetical protein
MPQAANDNRVGEAGVEAAGPRPCPICGKPQVHAFRPFCSRRCADVDLARWLGGRYTIPAESVEAEEGRDEAARDGES